MVGLYYDRGMVDVICGGQDVVGRRLLLIDFHPVTSLRRRWTNPDFEKTTLKTNANRHNLSSFRVTLNNPTDDTRHSVFASTCRHDEDSTTEKSSEYRITVVVPVIARAGRLFVISFRFFLLRKPNKS